MPLLAVLLLWANPAQSLARDESFRILEAHNAHRAQFGSSPLHWSKNLAQRATQWANYLIDENRFGPRRDGVFGENLYEINGAFASPEEVVAAWMSEARYYRVQTNTCTVRCGHFTQVVWHDTRLVGCAEAHNHRRQIWVCNYDPPGNVLGERPYP